MSYDMMSVTNAAQNRLEQIKKTEAKLNEQLVTGRMVNHPDEDPGVYRIVDATELGVANKSVIKRAIEGKYVLARFTLDATDEVKKIATKLMNKVLSARGQSVVTRAVLQQDVTNMLSQINLQTSQTMGNEASMIKSGATDIKVFLDDKFYSTLSDAPSVTIPAHSLDTTTLGIASLNIGAIASASGSTWESTDNANIKLINDALARVYTAETAFASAVSNLENYASLMDKSMKSMKSGLDKMIGVDKTSKYAELKSLEVQRQLATQAYINLSGSKDAFLLQINKK